MRLSHEHVAGLTSSVSRMLLAVCWRELKLLGRYSGRLGDGFLARMRLARVPSRESANWKVR